MRQERGRRPHRLCYQVCSRLGYWNTILLGNRRRQCGAQASGLASLSEGLGVFTHQLLSVCWLKAAGGEQRKTLNSPGLLAALCFSRAGSGGRQSPQAELQEVRLGWHGRHQGRYWQHRLTQVTQTVYFRLAIEQFSVDECLLRGYSPAVTFSIFCSSSQQNFSQELCTTTFPHLQTQFSAQHIFKRLQSLSL